MNTFKYELLAQGIGLPKFSQTAKVQNVAGLDTQQPGWRIRHPQAMTDVGKFVSHTSITGIMPALSCGYPIRHWLKMTNGHFQ